MVKIDLRTKLFDTVLAIAVNDNFQQELDIIPPVPELSAEYSVSSELDQKIKHMIAKNNHVLFLRKFGRISKRAAVIVIAFLPIAAAGLLSVEASRNAIFNAILDWKSDHAEIRYEQAASVPPTQRSVKPAVLVPAYLPDGFEQSAFDQVGPTTIITYHNKQDIKIRFTQCPLSKSGTSGIDTEHSVYHEITINGYKAQLFAAKTPKDSTILLWQNKTTSFMLISLIDKEELIQMATSISEPDE